MKISMLIMNAYGVGGTIRATANLADELAKRHDVEIVSVFRHRDRPHLPPSGRVTLRHLVDLRPEARRWWRLASAARLRMPSRLFHPEERAYRTFNAESDRALKRYLPTPGTDVLITTRAGLTIAAARLAPAGTVLIGQEHLHHGAYRPGIARQIAEWYPKLDALITLTDADRAAYDTVLRGARTRLYTIGNGLPDRPRPQSSLDEHVIVAAGRLVKVKGYDRLLDAFAKVVRTRPDWTLRIYGRGTLKDELARRARALGLDGHVAFMGVTEDMDAAFAEASLHVVTSRFEGFGMTIVEAFGCGVPVVSFDCPQGPREIVTVGQDGLLVPDGDVDAFADALLSLIEDPDELRRLAANARETARRFAITEIAGQWEKVLADLRGAARPRPARAGGHPH